jgi:hypothetical protein
MRPDYHINTIDNRGRGMYPCSLSGQNVVSLPAILLDQITKITSKEMKTSEKYASIPCRSDSPANGIEYIFHRKDKRI